MKRRAVLLVLSVLVAAAGTGLIAVYVKGADDRAKAGQDLVSVLVAVKPIERGTSAGSLLTTNSGLVKKEAVQVGAVPENVVPSDISGEALNALGTTLVDIAPKQPLSANLFSPTRGATAVTEETKDNTEILVPLSGPQSAAGLIQIGGNVTVLITDKGSAGRTKVLIPSALVVSINGVEGETGTGSGAQGADSTVGLSVPIKQALQLAWAQENDRSLYLVTQTPQATPGLGQGVKDLP